MEERRKLFCLGDSVTFGYGVRPSQRWTGIMAREHGWEVVNKGVNGDTTGGMLTRLQARVLAEVKRELSGGGRPYVLLMGGSNDIFYSGSDTSARANMGAMVHQMLSAGILPMVGIPLPVAPAFAPEAWAAVVDFAAAAEKLTDYCAWLKRYCAAFGLPYVDFRADFLTPNGTVREALLLDGLHPTPEGHRLMAARLCARLDKS